MANPRDFYRYINNQKKDRQGIQKRGGNGVAELDSERAEELIGQFSDAFSKTEYNEVQLIRRLAPFMDSIVVSTEGVIKRLESHKSFRTFVLHPRVLKELQCSK